MRGGVAQMDPPAAELDEDEDVQCSSPGGLYREEVARDDALRLGPEELGPRWAAASRCRTESRSSEQGPDRRRSNPDPELAQLALDPHAAPAGVLPGQPEDERTDFRVDGRSSWATGPAVGPLLPHEFAMPPQHGCRCDDEADPALARDHSARGRTRI